MSPKKGAISKGKANVFVQHYLSGDIRESSLIPYSLPRLASCDSVVNNHTSPQNNMGVSKNKGTPKWMVYKGKPYEQMDDLGCFPYFWFNIHMVSNHTLWIRPERSAALNARIFEYNLGAGPHFQNIQR